jgi:hypothetical protein
LSVEKSLRKLLLCLPVAGFLSGALTISLMAVPRSTILYGFIYGALIGALLTKARVLDKEGWAWLTLAAEIAAVVSLYGSAANIFLRLPLWNPTDPRYPKFESPVALLMGGAAGGLLIVGILFWRFWRAQRIGASAAMLKTINGAVCGGALAVVGWALTDALGTPVWHLLNVFHLTGLSYEPSGQLNLDQANFVYSLCLIWQTGMALVIALLLWDYEPLAGPTGPMR